MCELTNQQAYDYYHEVKESCAKDYWYEFLKSRANRGVEEDRTHNSNVTGLNPAVFII